MRACVSEGVTGDYLQPPGDPDDLGHSSCFPEHHWSPDNHLSLRPRPPPPPRLSRSNSASGKGGSLPVLARCQPRRGGFRARLCRGVSLILVRCVPLVFQLAAFEARPGGQ
ncbi:hypothetical protein DPEC_G00102540 [Dallia pectoralis]|uniref:Uncharacterized protein n=1 Tax=Dallia pectoralis TaxID=75939 RepID=A0ACC2GXI8_DALPE|nr:hypothetical protein DPEC_G00102540 [Dallia pectoralis]